MEKVYKNSQCTLEVKGVTGVLRVRKVGGIDETNLYFHLAKEGRGAVEKLAAFLQPLVGDSYQYEEDNKVKFQIGTKDFVVFIDFLFLDAKDPRIEFIMKGSDANQVALIYAGWAASLQMV